MTPEFSSYVEALFEAFMQAEYPSVAYYFDNSDAPESTKEQYAVIHIMPSEDAIPINTGINAKSRNVGIIQVDAFSPVDIGPGTAHNLANACGLLYKRRVAAVANEGTVTFKDHSTVSRGQIGGKFKYMMRIPYRYDFKQ